MWRQRCRSGPSVQYGVADTGQTERRETCLWRESELLAAVAVTGLWEELGRAPRRCPRSTRHGTAVPQRCRASRTYHGWETRELYHREYWCTSNNKPNPHPRHFNTKREQVHFKDRISNRALNWSLQIASPSPRWKLRCLGVGEGTTTKAVMTNTAWSAWHTHTNSKSPSYTVLKPQGMCVCEDVFARKRQ